MHIIVSWEILDRNSILQNAIRKELCGVFSGFSWVRPLSNFYIVKLNEPEDRQSIRVKLVEIAQRRKERKQRIRMLISPVIMAGAYSGFLGVEMWEKINQRTKQDA